MIVTVRSYRTHRKTTVQRFTPDSYEMVERLASYYRTNYRQTTPTSATYNHYERVFFEELVR